MGPLLYTSTGPSRKGDQTFGHPLMATLSFQPGLAPLAGLCAKQRACPTVHKRRTYHHPQAQGPKGEADLRQPPRAVTFNGNLTRKEMVSLKVYIL